MGRKAVLAGGALLGAAILLGASGEVPAWTLRGSRFAKAPSLAPFGRFPIHIRQGGTIVVRGDSNATAVRIVGARAWPWWLSRKLGGAVRIVTQAHGGDKAGQARQRHGPFPPGTDLCIVMLGTNDAAPRGWLAHKRPTPVANYSAQMHAMIADCRARGASVLVLAPPPAGSRGMNRRLAPYRSAAREVAIATGARFLDPSSPPAPLADRSKVLLNYDALHLNARSHRDLGEWLGQEMALDKAP